MNKQMNLRKIRENDLMLSRTELAQKAGIGKTTIEEAESTNRLPKRPVVRARYMRALGLDPAEVENPNPTELSEATA